METPTSKSPHTLFWIAGIAVTLFSAVGIAAVMGWIPTSMGSPSESVVAAPAAQPAAPVTHAKTQAQLEAEAQARADKRAQVKAAKARCANCGVVESIREVDTKGEGTGLGAVGGAVAGGVLGNQVGDGSGRKIATVAGAVGGAVAGHQIEKYAKSTKSYEITVRFENGSSSVIHEASAPAWRVGERVKVSNGVIRSNA